MTRSLLGALGTGLVFLAILGGSALAQEGVSRSELPIRDINRRSGLLFRYNPPDFARFGKANLPPDPKRDTFYDGRRWADNPKVTPPNLLCHGGLYGLPLPTGCVQSELPYFYGYTGRSSYNPDCCRPPRPVYRLVQNFVHPFRPVGMYYSHGSYVPIYDLDPLVTGPGPFPWPHFLKRPLGG